jgi:hypothetical protein
MSDFQVLRRPAHQVAAEVEENLSSILIGEDMTEQERQIISAVFKHPDSQIDVVIPDNIKADDLAAQVVACTKVFSRVGRAQRRMVPILGRMFNVLQYRKDVLDILGCKNFTDFMDNMVPKVFYINRNDAYACLRIAREFPQITVNTFDGLTIAKLKVIARAIPYNNGMISERQMNVRNELIEQAKGMPYEGLVNHMHDLGIVDKESVMPAKIVVKTSEDIADKWRKFAADPRVQSYVGSTNEGTIIDAMMGECFTTWIALYQADEN